MSADFADRIIIAGLFVLSLGPPNLLATMLAMDGVLSQSDASQIMSLSSAIFIFAFAYVMYGFFDAFISSEVSLIEYTLTAGAYTALFAHATVKHIGAPIADAVGLGAAFAIMATFPLLEHTSLFRGTVESISDKLAGLEGSL
jgi:hypothetical protein